MGKSSPFSGMIVVLFKCSHCVFFFLFGPLLMLCSFLKDRIWWSRLGNKSTYACLSCDGWVKLTLNSWYMCKLIQIDLRLVLSEFDSISSWLILCARVGFRQSVYIHIRRSLHSLCLSCLIGYWEVERRKQNLDKPKNIHLFVFILTKWS